MPTLTVMEESHISLTGRVYNGLTLCDAIKSLGNTPQMNCGGKAICASCKVLVLDGQDQLSLVTEKEDKRLNKNDLTNHYRLGCQAMIMGDVSISLSQSIL